MANNALKIAIVLNTSWNIYNFRLGLVRQLIKAGHQVFAIAPPDQFVDEITATGCQYIPLKHLSRKGVNPYKDLRFCYELYRIYKLQHFDFVLHYTIKPNIYGSIAARWSKVASMSTVTGLGYSFMKEGFVNKVVKRLYKFAFRSAHCVAFQNSDDLHLFRQLNLTTETQSILIKGSGVNTSFFCPLPMSNSDRNHTVFLFVGRLLYDKGVRELFQAAKILKSKQPKTEIWVVGAIDKDNPSAISQELVDEYVHQNIIQYLGRSEDVRSIIKEADVVVLPSYREGLPRVMLESLSMSKPVITTDAPGCKETVKDGINGYMVPVADAQKFAEAMLKITELPADKLLKMGEEGRKMALEEFDEQVIIRHYLNIIGQL